ncbi:MAG: hypothetical protein JWO25_3285 [Alphaproteobacteria bacterium]|nr:hypothetical protein [Alphaproteobacteria bacterium]
MANDNNEVIQRLFQRFFRDELPGLSTADRSALEGEFEDRYGELLQRSSSGTSAGFSDLVGFGDGPVKPFDALPVPLLRNDFDESVIPPQLLAAAELYYIYQMERMKLFRVVNVLRRLFENGQIRIQRGPGARGLYILEKWRPIRYKRRDRLIAYRRVFNYGRAPIPAGAIVNRNFHFQMVAFMNAMSQYFRDLTIGQVIRGSMDINDRPFAALAIVQRVGTDLRYQLDRASYGNILALTREVGQYLQQVFELLDTPDIKRSFDANTKWDVIEQVADRYLDGALEMSQRAKMAEAGRRSLQWIAENDFRSSLSPLVFEADSRVIGAQADAWIAAYRLTAEGRRFPSNQTDRMAWAPGLDAASASRIAA